MATTAIAVREPVALDPVERVARLDENPAAVYVARLGSKHSRRAAMSDIKILAALLGMEPDAVPWAALRYQHTGAIRARLGEMTTGNGRRYAPRSVNRFLNTLRGILREAWRLGQMTAEEYHRAVDVEKISAEPLPAGRALSAGELRALFEACARDPTPAGRRDAALLGVLYGGGLRRSEAAALRVGDFDPETGRVTVREGKRRKSRTVYLPEGGRRAVDAWLAVRGPDAGALFVPVGKGGAVRTGQGVSSQSIYAALRKRGREAGIAGFTPHDLRRTFIGDLFENGADASAIRAQAGHSSIDTTARYDRRGERAKQKAAGFLNVPFVG